MRQLLLILLLALVLPSLSEVNRCGDIQDDRTVYKNFYDPSNGQQILEIHMDATNTTSGYTWQNVLDDRDKWDKYEPWIYCKVVIGNATVALPCEAQRRGDWAMESPLPSLRVKFVGKGIKYRDMDRLLLNKHPWDPTRVKNKISYELLQEIPNLSSLYTHFVHLIVDGQSYGLYTMLEDIRDDMMKTHGLKKSSNLYKANKVSWDLAKDYRVREVDDPKYNETDFESHWDVRGEKNHSILMKAYREIFNANLESQFVIENNFNIDNFATWLAFVILTGNNDLVFNNFGIYAPKSSKGCEFPTPLYMMAWDNDGAWGESPQNKKMGVSDPWYDYNLPYFWNSRLIRRFYEVDSNVDLLITKMTWMIENPLSPTRIRALTDTYKPIIQPILSAEPDASHLAWRNTITGWARYLDAMSAIPTFHFNSHADYLKRPMPVHANMTFSSDSSSLFIWWGQSFVLKHKPFFYELQVADNVNFTTPLVNVITNNTHVSVSTSIFSPSTTYYWRLLIKNAESPSHYMTTYLSLTKESGWGVSSFKTPSTLSPLSAVSPASVTNSATVTGTSIQYATLSNVDPTSTSSVACSSTPASIPSGWMIAHNNAETRGHLSSLALPWAKAVLVTSGGHRLSPSGSQLEGFGEFPYHLIEHRAVSGRSYVANCTVGAAHVLLTTARGTIPTDPTDAPTTPTGAPTDPTGAPTDPTGAPTDPTDAPTDPTGAPTDPTDAPTTPTDPTDAPATPSDAPTTPTDPTETPVNPQNPGDNDESDQPANAGGKVAVSAGLLAVLAVAVFAF